MGAAHRTGWKETGDKESIISGASCSMLLVEGDALIQKPSEERHPDRHHLAKLPTLD